MHLRKYVLARNEVQPKVGREFFLERLRHERTYYAGIYGIGSGHQAEDFLMPKKSNILFQTSNLAFDIFVQIRRWDSET